MSIESLQSQIAEEFTTQYGHPPQFIAAAPGRVNLIGEHIDYNDGYVLPMAIDRHTLVAVASNNSPIINIAAPDMHDSTTIDLSTSLEPRPGHWTGYVLGVAAGIQTRVAPVNGFDALIRSNVPLGGGLSSSAALTVAFATAMEALTGLTLKPLDKALLCKAAENNFAGVPCGIMDPLTCVAGERDHALLIDCVTHEIKTIPFDTNDVAVLITNSGVKHDLAENAYAQRQQECRSALEKLGAQSWREVTNETIEATTALNHIERRRAQHIVSEIARTLEAARALSTNNWSTVGQLMRESHASLRDDFQVSCTELDQLVNIQNNLSGVHGARLTGGGFGGCTVALVDTNAEESVIQQTRTAYAQATRIQTESFITHPSDGARIL